MGKLFKKLADRANFSHAKITEHYFKYCMTCSVFLEFCSTSRILNIGFYQIMIFTLVNDDSVGDSLENEKEKL